MLRVNRSVLPAELQTALEQAQTTNVSWEDFAKTEDYQNIKQCLRLMFHGKCAYCETADAQSIEHHWPKSPHPHNAGKGTPARMFDWVNVLLACTGCNGFECKASHMKWDANGNPVLLNVCIATDDPLCYFAIALDGSSHFALGWMDPKPGLNPSAFERAEYTIRRLKLNQREHLLRGRRKNTQRFFELMHYLREFGPDYEAPSGHKVREKFAELLSAYEPFLAPIRQILYAEPAFAHLKTEMVSAMPELEPILNAWALPLADCAHTV